MGPGDDEFGRMLAAILRENGVDDCAVVFDGGARTALAFVTLRADGEREFMFYRNPSADVLLTVDELNVDLLKRVSESPSNRILITQQIIKSLLRDLAKEGSRFDPIDHMDTNARFPLVLIWFAVGVGG